MDFSIAEPLTVEEVAVIVCDTGRGIMPEDVPKLFGKFYRGKNPLSDSSTDGTPDDAAGRAETPGVGLGLYLAKRLITALGGRIKFAVVRRFTARLIYQTLQYNLRRLKPLFQ